MHKNKLKIRKLKTNSFKGKEDRNSLFWDENKNNAS